MKERNPPHISLAHAYWKSHLSPGDNAIDATCGNGYDTFALAKLLLSHPDSLLLGFDIQSSALEQTESLLKQSLPEEHLARVLFQRRCHSELDQVPLPHPPKLVVYNLGYLPGSDKSITTLTPSTLSSLEKATSLLAPEHGALSITCYPGHPEGKKEEDAIVQWAEKLPSHKWQVCHHRWLNRKASPSLLWIRSIS
jgi:hypothetical protein